MIERCINLTEEARWKVANNIAAVRLGVIAFSVFGDSCVHVIDMDVSVNKKAVDLACLNGQGV